jgi:NADH pyrophosphatase NudC (nudix superfamily)
MIKRHEFLNLVDSSIQYTAEEVVYLIVGETDMFCPFCGKQLTMENGKIRCDCEESGEISKRRLEIKKIISDAKFKLDAVENIIKEASFDFYKEYFKTILVPQLRDNLENSIKDILDYELGAQ